MKAILFTGLILLFTKLAKAQEYCRQDALGPYAYNNKFSKLEGKSGLYEIKVNNPDIYTACGRKLSFKKGDKIYVSCKCDFYKGIYNGKSGKWAQTIIDFDGSGPRWGTYVYVFFKNLKYIPDLIQPKKEDSIYRSVFIKRLKDVEDNTYRNRKNNTVTFSDSSQENGIYFGLIKTIIRYFAGLALVILFIRAYERLH